MRNRKACDSATHRGLVIGLLGLSMLASARVPAPYRPASCQTWRIRTLAGRVPTNSTPDVPPDAVIYQPCQKDRQTCAFFAQATPDGICNGSDQVCECRTDADCSAPGWAGHCLQESGAPAHCACTSDAQCGMFHACDLASGRCYRPVPNVDVAAAPYSAATDGSADATCAFRQAIHDVVPGGRVHVPKGLYALGDIIEVWKHIRLSGDGYYNAMETVAPDGELRTKWLDANLAPVPSAQVSKLYGTADGFGGTVLWTTSPFGGLVIAGKSSAANLDDPRELNHVSAAVSFSGEDFMMVGAGAPGSVGLALTAYIPPNPGIPEINPTDPNPFSGVVGTGGGRMGAVSLHNILVADFDVGFRIANTLVSQFDGLHARGVGTGIILDNNSNIDAFTDISVIGFTNAGLDLELLGSNLFKGGLLSDSRRSPLSGGVPRSGIGIWARESCPASHPSGLTIEGFDFRQHGVPGLVNMPVNFEQGYRMTIRQSRFNGSSQCVGLGNVSKVDFADSALQQDTVVRDTSHQRVKYVDIARLSMDATGRVAATDATADLVTSAGRRPRDCPTVPNEAQPEQSPRPSLGVTDAAQGPAICMPQGNAATTCVVNRDCGYPTPNRWSYCVSRSAVPSAGSSGNANICVRGCHAASDCAPGQTCGQISVAGAVLAACQNDAAR